MPVSAAILATVLSAAVISPQIASPFPFKVEDANLNKTFPTLSELCLDTANLAGTNASVGLVGVTIGNIEIFELQLKCNFKLPGSSSGVVTGMRLVPMFLRMTG